MIKALFASLLILIFGSQAYGAESISEFNQATVPVLNEEMRKIRQMAEPEYGTWTPTLTFTTPGDLSVVYANRVGEYIKHGRFVHLMFRIQTSTFTHSTASGELRITGVPFKAAEITSGTGGVAQWRGACVWRGITKANFTDMNGTVIESDNKISLGISGSGQTNAIISTGDMPSAGTVVLECTIPYKSES